MKRSLLLLLFVSTVLTAYGFPPAAVQVPATPPAIVTYQNGNSRLGQNLQETILTTTSVNATNFGKIFSWTTDGSIYAQPLYLPNVTINGSVHNVLYVVTEADGIYAFDADSKTQNPAPLWYTSLVNGSTVIPVPCLDHHAACTIYPTLGITGTPAINLATNTMYLVARTKEIVNGNTTNPNYVERLHAIDITTGVDQLTPTTICSAPYTTSNLGCQFTSGLFNPLQDGQRPGILLEPTSGFSQGVLWIGFAGQGMMLAFDASNLAQLADWTATPTPKNTTGGGGIWGSGGGVSGDANGNVFVSIGDGTFDVNVGGNNYGDSIVKLNLVSNGSGGYVVQVMDYFTPPDEACRQTTDTDLGSGGPVLLPPQPGSVPNLIVIAGKGDVPACDSANPMFLVNADNMGGLGGGVQSVATTAAVGFWSSAAYYSTGIKNNIYLGGSVSVKVGDSLRQYQLTNGLLGPTASKSIETYLAGPTPFVTANGTKQGIVWTVQRPEIVDNEKGVNPAVLHAYTATNLHTELYTSSTNATRDALGPAVKFGVPTVVNGKAYVGTQTELDVFGVCPCPAP
jgi:hypothetical protein